MTEASIVERLERQTDRVRDHSAQSVNRRIVRGIEGSVARCIGDGRDAVLQRLAEIDREWDIDRVLMANFAVIGGAAYALGLERYARRRFLRPRRKGWLYFVGVQMAFLFTHAAVGWCPPVVVWRRLGVRTKAEIDVERSLLREAVEPSLTAADGAGPLSVSPQITS
jgi:hypothetical protein